MKRRTCLRSKIVKGLRQLKTSQWLACESGWSGTTRQTRYRENGERNADLPKVFRKENREVLISPERTRGG